MDKRKAAGKDYAAGMKYKDISAKYGVPIGTLKSWRTRDGWKKGATTTKQVQPKRKKDAPKVAPKIIDELEANSELTDKQKLFCLFYLQRFNATWAYQQAYKCSYETARVEGSRTLANPNIKSQLIELKKQQRSELLVTIDDIAHEYAKQAFASLGDVLDYKVHEELVVDTDGNAFLDTDDNPVKKHVADIYLKPSDQIDWSLIQDIHRGKDGLVVKLYDKQKALDSLSKLIGDDDDNANEQKIRKLKADADIAEAKAKRINNTDETVRIVFNDNLKPDKEDNQDNGNQS
ncbi:terminase small subunit [Lactiplantibacillus plantarum]|uniref:Phage terminase small subunit n=1 Tax=Lactiplantibacillus plantarum WJL TaxID=1350466 RepID=A0A837PB34_LACPN|nr:terminase small subunit [Lactiplantibacillus plantarum]ASZ31969.1 terminase [Lactiplantibacillus plantarum]ERO41082.1 prophage terminase small subunit [Lactiplantibacillus plantarum WJL]KPN44276.1 Phage terminase small subunit [Lactiplantibacillus plantarum WJL]WGJ12124.1 terminase small subunit [Lactiplantibacillus plantarum]